MKLPNLKTQITNPILQETEGQYGTVAEAPLTSLIVRLWRTTIILGSLTLLIYSLWGGLEWITAQGDPEKLKSAKAKITNGIMGLAILVMLFAILTFVGYLFGFDLLNIDWGFAGDGAGTGAGGGAGNGGGTGYQGGGDIE
jgi:hypothetical protein